MLDYQKGVADISKEVPRGEERNEIIRIYMIQFKNDLDDILGKFQEKWGGQMQELDFYTFSIKMQKEHYKMCDNFNLQVQSLTSFNFFDNTDLRNLVKICPYCGLIWSKITSEGCDGQTTCGARVAISLTSHLNLGLVTLSPE